MTREEFIERLSGYKTYIGTPIFHIHFAVKNEEYDPDGFLREYGITVEDYEKLRQTYMFDKFEKRDNDPRRFRCKPVVVAIGVPDWTKYGDTCECPMDKKLKETLCTEFDECEREYGNVYGFELGYGGKFL